VVLLVEVMMTILTRIMIKDNGDCNDNGGGGGGNDDDDDG
jgi:hypothetical protein